ncbi:MAG TPA: hypothetical protein VJ481_00250 [Patescibacteria group bacterium]|uniref:Glycosyltransferase RgtA/B/C/D-like domain-containing protein n=1 Tax=Candidatus Woesebacteria bacterium RBG_13_46_13 TaxID=1802479 RepID=A0A1F7X3A5_9BACT|nr:MAG: hypothetical protein A2Y68_00120 [Candidatus Woesebacteria bacterium RBG_13_46_13]HJX58973.1 hypothetical protein [Patescibacteria group bacterium]
MGKICYYLFGLKLPLYINFALPAFIFYDLIKKILSNKYFRILLIFVLPTIIFIKILRNDPFFLSDDFAHLYLSYRASYLQIAKLALTGPGIWVANRIVIGFWIFKALFDLFGPKPEVFLTLMFVFHLVNVAIFYLISERLTKNSILSLFSTFIISSFYLTWISNIHEVVGATFILASSYYFLLWLSKEKSINISLVFFILAVFTKEIAFLFPLVLAMIALYHHFNASRLDLKKTIKSMAPFFAVFLVYLFTYGISNFKGYSVLPSNDSYQMTFSIKSIIKNAIYYLTYNFPLINYKPIGFLVLIVPIFYDLWKRKPVITPFAISYLLLLSPVLLFADRRTFYYAYIPAFFLFFGLTILVKNIYWPLIVRLKTAPKPFTKVLNILVILFFLLTVFRLEQLFMDNCFLIQFPWQKPQKATYLSMLKKIDTKFELGQLKEGDLYILSDEELALELEVVSPLLESKEASAFSLRYLPEQKALLVEKR